MPASFPFKSALLSGAASLLALPVGLPAFSQELLDIGEVVVTPNRTPTETSKVGSTVNTVDNETIEAQSLPAVTDYLTLLPGVAVSSAGGIGTEGSLSVRGAPRRYVKTLYNGIDISDPTSTQVQTSYQYLLGSSVENIEVLKGSQSTLYGSEAIAGVISISTLSGIELGMRHHIHAEGGSFDSARGGYGLRAANEDSRLSLNIAGFRTDGISAAANGTERDGYENLTADINAEHRFSENFSVFASGLYIDAEAEFDNDFPISDSLTATNLNRQLAGRIGFDLDFMDGRLQNTVSFQGFDINREIVGTFFDGIYDGQRRKADYQGSFDATDWLTLQYGGDYERQGIEVPGAAADFTLGGIWAQAIMEPVENFVLTGGLRHDEHSAFGGHTTYRGTGSYLFEETGTRLHASAGTGFRAPSLNELFGPFGANPDLQPETSTSFDIGVEQTFLNGALVADVTLFHLDVDDLIDYVCPDPVADPFCLTGGYAQTEGTTRSRGLEASLVWRANPWLDLGAAYTYTDSELPNGDRNIRVPRHAVGLTVSAQPWERWTFSAAAKVAIDTVDAGGVELDDYVLVNAKLAYKPTDDTELYLRAENLLDQDYQTVRGFGTPGFSAFAGFKATF